MNDVRAEYLLRDLLALRAAEAAAARRQRQSASSPPAAPAAMPAIGTDIKLYHKYPFSVWVLSSVMMEVEVT